MIKDAITGTGLDWHWGLAGNGMVIEIHQSGKPKAFINLTDDQLETFVRILCKKLPGEYVPHRTWMPTEPMTQTEFDGVVSFLRERIVIDPDAVEGMSR